MNWISVKDKLPNNGEQVLVFDRNKDYHISEYRYGNWQEPYYGQDISDIIDATHWMPLPNEPSNGIKDKL